MDRAQLAQDWLEAKTELTRAEEREGELRQALIECGEMDADGLKVQRVVQPGRVSWKAAAERAYGLLRRTRPLREWVESNGFIGDGFEQWLFTPSFSSRSSAEQDRRVA